jgi:integral membrane sensor domain MASE1
MNSQLKVTLKSAKSIAIYLLEILALAVIYHLAARVGLKMAYVQINTSPVWPPTGIALAALLIFGYRLWPGISLGVLLGSVLNGADIGVALGMALGNTLEALVGAYLLKSFVNFHNSMDRIRDVVGLGAVSVLSTAISATIGTLTLMQVGSGDWGAFGAIWSTWWIGDFLGALVIAPVLLVWIAPPSMRLHKQQYMEGLTLLALVIFVTWYVFGGKPPDGILHQALLYLVFPFIIWAGLRLGQHGATLTMFIISGIAIWGTVQGLGPFSLESKNDSLILLQTFLAVVSLTALILAAATTERRDSADALRQRADELSTLNDSSRTFLDNFEIANIYHTICRLAVTHLGLDVAWLEVPSREDGEACPSAIAGIPAEALEIQKRQWGSYLQSPPKNARMVVTVDDIHPPIANSTYNSYAEFPLIFSNQPIGALKLLSRSKDFFSVEKQFLIQSYTNLAAVR